MDSLLEEVISQIRACLISTKGKCDLHQIKNDYKMLMGSPIPYSQLGYKNLEDFICSIPSLTTTCSNGQIFVDAKITEKSSHISNFVDRQKTSKKKRPLPKQTYKKFSSAPPRWRPKTNNNWKNPFETSPRFAAVAHTQMVSSRLQPERKFVQTDRKEETASTSPVENFKEVSNSLTQQAKRRLSQKMVNLNFQDLPIEQETLKTTENDLSDTQSDENAFLRTGNHLMDLRTFALQNNLGEPIIKTKVQNQKNLRNPPSYYCKIQLDDVSGSSYPLDIHEEETAKQEAARKLLDMLQEKWRLKNRRDVIISDDSDILQRIPSMVRVHQWGVWNREIEETYLKRYKEQLPSNWLEIVDTLPYIAILRIHDQFVLNYCDPKEVFQKKNGTNVPSKNVSVQPNPVKFDEDELFVAEITCITSAAEVWCCQRDTPVWHSFCKMVYELEKYYNTRGAHEKAAIIQIGGYYVALHDQMWCRVRVFEVNNDDIHCFCIDFGDEWVIKKDHLFNLDKAFAEEHAQAFVCRLAGVEELYEASKSSERLQSFLGKVVQVQVESHLETSIDRNNPAIPVVLYDETGSPINEQIITLMSMEMALPTLTINTPTEVHVTHALSDGTVYVQLRTKGFEHLMSLIDKAGQNIVDEKISIQPVAVSKSENDRMYLVQYGESKSWQRVQIIDWSPYDEKFAQILFVDTGNTAVVTVKDISFYALDEISDVISKFPTQGYLVRLPLKHVPPNFEEKIYELMPPDEAVLVKSLRIDDDYVPIVEFFKRSESDNVLFSVNMTLTDQFKQNGDDANNTYGGKSQSKKLQILMSLNQFEDMLSRYQVDVVEMLKKNDFIEHVPSTGQLPCPKIPELGQYFDVKIPCAVHPHNFVVQPYESATKLNKLMEVLQERYKNVQYSPILIDDVSPGKIFASRHTDGKWYRTSVIKVIHSGSISVFYCDFGYYGNLSVHDLVPLDNEFMELPYQAIKAKLADVQPRNSNWSMEDCKDFADLVCKKSFVSIVKGMEKDVLYRSDTILILKLIDTSTNEDIHIEQILIDRGIAISTS